MTPIAHSAAALGSVRPTVGLGALAGGRLTGFGSEVADPGAVRCRQGHIRLDWAVILS